MDEAYDVVIVGAGLAGINCAYRLQTELPGTSFKVLEGRERLGGTWDLFKFPGVRSDSDLPSLGFAWHPWPYEQIFAEGSLILNYMKDAVSKHKIDKHIQFQQKVVSASWSSSAQRWELEVVSQGRTRPISAGFLALGTGWYDYETPLQTIIPGLEKFKGKTLHPQFWPEQYDYSGKKLAVIGSGATAITLIPRLAEQAAGVTMVQRSPVFIAQKANSTPLSSWARKVLPLPWVLIWERFFHITTSYLLILLCRALPKVARFVLLKGMAASLPERVKAKPHFEPSYTPWTQRICLAPDGDFFSSLSRSNVHVVTGKIDTVTEHHIQMKDGTSVEADAIITATGLNMKLGGNVELRVDGEVISWEKRMVWNGAMLDGVPNLVWMLGYTDNAWTLGADAVALILVRVLRYMRRKQATSVVPRAPEDATAETRRVWPLNSTYRQMADQRLPVYGVKGPWAPKRVSPFADYWHSRWGNVTDGLEVRPMKS
jgi:cation diffusion facilitator CzcD-associated flavoprotein CzcO